MSSPEDKERALDVQRSLGELIALAFRRQCAVTTAKVARALWEKSVAGDQRRGVPPGSSASSLVALSMLTGAQKAVDEATEALCLHMEARASDHGDLDAARRYRSMRLKSAHEVSYTDRGDETPITGNDDDDESETPLH
jgi:hypothetical protein